MGFLTIGMRTSVLFVNCVFESTNCIKRSLPTVSGRVAQIRFGCFTTQRQSVTTR